MRILVLGTEPYALAIAAVAAGAGHAVSLWAGDAPSEAVAAIRAAGGMHLTGAGRLDAVVSIAVDDRPLRGAASDVDLIVVATRLRDHTQVAAALASAAPDAGILLAPGGVGGALAFQYQVAVRFVAEAPGFPILADIDGAHVRVRGLKRGLPVGVVPHEQTPAAVAAIRSLGLDVAPACSVTDTSLANTNVLIHPPLVLANWARLESGRPYRLYREGLSAAGARLIDAIDQERLRLAAALGAETISVADWLRHFYADQGMRGADVLELLGGFPAFESTLGPTSIDHRYLTDDVPFGLVPLAALGRAVDVSMPTIEAVITCLGALGGTDFRSAGRSLDDMGLAGLSPASVRKHLGQARDAARA